MKLAYTNNETGGVDIVDPFPQDKKIGWKPMPDEDYMAHVVKRSIPKGVEFIYLEDDQVPSDRYFRTAWRLSGEAIEIDMVKARQIQMDKIRRIRNKELKLLDTNILLLEDMEQPVTDQRKKRQVLRDIPQTFDLESVQTLEELKNAWPQVLPS